MMASFVVAHGYAPLDTFLKLVVQHSLGRMGFT
jgi:hypothetical protein